MLFYLDEPHSILFTENRELPGWRVLLLKAPRRAFSRWALEDSAGRFVGYTGVMPSAESHPLGPHAEIGWRLVRSAWGIGYATEAARAALDDVFARRLHSEILAYTSGDNIRSQAVMDRLGLIRDTTRDFVWYKIWHGLVWVARPN